MVILIVRELIISVIALLMLCEYAISLKLLELDVPKYLPLGTRAALSCRWQLAPADVLYSVKWYKDGKEFFRHVPRDVEPRRKFPLPGVDVEEFDSSGSRLHLSAVTVESGGRYRCEVSGEKPLFPTVSEYKDMSVVVLPEHGPVISGFHTKYRIGDKVQVSCNSGHSKPATQLSWYINDELLPLETARYRSENGLIVTNVNLNFEVSEKHFRNNVLKVKCIATIVPLYWKSNEESAIQDKNKVYRDILSMAVKDKDAEDKPSHFNSSNKLLTSFQRLFFESFISLIFRIVIN